MDPAEALDAIAEILETNREPTYRVRAFRSAAKTVRNAGLEQVATMVAEGKVKDLPGVGDKTAAVIQQALEGRTPDYLERLRKAQPEPVKGPGAPLRAALKGDLHLHSDWSDGGSPIRTMAETAIALGHEYMALTDHSPRLTIANGLSPERLREQLKVLGELNEELAPFRILRGIEVDILDDGSLDQDPKVLAGLDVVVASVHSKLRMERNEMTERMIRAVAHPHVDVLGHCTGRNVSSQGRTGKKRPESDFDADLVFEACSLRGVAVEVNSRPERQDPPKRLLRIALEAGCFVSIDTDAHAPGQLAWQDGGCDRAFRCGVTAERADALNVTSWDVGRVVAHGRRHDG